ncbi:ArsR/SmtB family transcription factor [Alicyclobacillus macrosporangiidus]|uniref:ArsR/SmtB family transcription factor n=1 Tax=Alicyclobacillus macrosporangiidus TaxID=392015 RepID=UPI000495B01E
MTLSFEQWAEIYKALADKTRLHILALLRHDEMCVCELVEVLKMSQPAVSQHLRRLKQAGLVRERKTAQWVYYGLDGSVVPFFDRCLAQLPDVSEEIARLEAQGLRVCCESSPGEGAES